LNEKICKHIKKQYERILCLPCDNITELGSVTDEGVCTFSLDFCTPDTVINGFKSKSALTNNAFQSSECVANCEGVKKYLNLFEVVMCDTPNYKGEHNGPRFCGLKSRVQEYVNLLNDAGLDVAGVNFKWTSASNMVSINHQNLGMNPVKFARKTAKALKAVGFLYKKL
jgi:hypothetical protein